VRDKLRFLFIFTLCLSALKESNYKFGLIDILIHFIIPLPENASGILSFGSDSLISELRTFHALRYHKLEMQGFLTVFISFRKPGFISTKKSL
jgi:hypothetical protein